jgi:hypothetical protein
MEVNQEPLVEKVLTAEEQKQLSPEQVLQSLKDGNTRFTAGSLTLRDHSKQIRAAVNGQYPKLRPSYFRASTLAFLLKMFLTKESETYL